MSSSSEESAGVEEGCTPDKSQKETAHRHILTDLDGETKDLGKWHHDLRMKVMVSDTLIETND